MQQIQANFSHKAEHQDFQIPTNLPELIDTADKWQHFGSVERKLASRFGITDFGIEKVEEGQYIVFPFAKATTEAAPKDNDFKKLLDTFNVFGEHNAKSLELLQIMEAQKKKFAESGEFLQTHRMGFMKFVAQLVVFRREAQNAAPIAEALNNRCIPIRNMGDLESSTAMVNLRESLDFIVQQGLTLLGGQKAYDDLLAHWAELPAKQKQARDAGGAAPFWSAQKESSSTGQPRSRHGQTSEKPKRSKLQ